jgi:hypothetical protein
MKKLFVLYDADCHFCRRCRHRRWSSKAFHDTIEPVWKTLGSGIAEGLRRKGLRPVTMTELVN